MQQNIKTAQTAITTRSSISVNPGGEKVSSFRGERPIFLLI
jgi:hypothetical protein